MSIIASGEWSVEASGAVVAAAIAAAIALLTGAVTGIFALVRFHREQQRLRDERADRHRSEGWVQLQWAIDTALQGDPTHRWVGLNAVRLLIESPRVDDADKMRALALARALLGK